MYLKIQQKLRCLGCISNETTHSAVKKTRLDFLKDDFLKESFHCSTKRKLSNLLKFLFPCFSFNGVFLTLNCRTLGLKPPHGDHAAAMISFTKVSKYGKSEYSRALNATYTFQRLMSFWLSPMGGFQVTEQMFSAKQNINIKEVLTGEKYRQPDFGNVVAELLRAIELTTETVNLLRESPLQFYLLLCVRKGISCSLKRG